MAQKYTDEQLIESYKAFVNKLGRTPTQKELDNKRKNNKDFPSVPAFVKRFKGINNLNVLCGFELNYKTYTDKELICLLQEFYKNNGFPTKKMISNDDTMPNAELYRSRFGGFMEALKVANIPIPTNKEKSLKSNGCNLTDEELLNEFYVYYKSTNSVPKSSEFETVGLKSYRIYCTRFGSLKNVLQMLNINIDDKYKTMFFSDFKNKTDDELINILIEYHKTNGIPTTRKLQNNPTMPSSYLYRERFGTFKNALVLAGIDIPKDKQRFHDRDSIPTDTIINKLNEFISSNYTERDFLPNLKELPSLCDIPSESVLLNRFGSIVKLYKTIHIDYYSHNKKALEIDMIDKYINLKNILGFVPDSRDIDEYSKKGLCYGMKTYSEHFGSLIEFQKSLGFEPTASAGKLKSNEDLLEDLKSLYEKLGRVPSYQDINESEFCAGASIYKNKFGSYVEALKLCGIDVSKYKKVLLTTPKGNIAFSSYEYKFLLMLEEYNIEFKKEEFYKNYIPYLTERIQFDFTLQLNNNTYFVEIFGLMNKDWYKEKALRKIDLCNDHRLPLIDFYDNDFKKTTSKDLYDLLLTRINNINIIKKEVI